MIIDQQRCTSNLKSGERRDGPLDGNEPAATIHLMNATIPRYVNLEKQQMAAMRTNASSNQKKYSDARI